MGSAADDHRVDGGATAATAGVSTTLGRRGMPARKGRRRATRKGRVDKHCTRRAVRVRVATGGWDVMRRCLREERSVGWRGISGKGVWWRLWEHVHGLLVTRGFAVCIVTGLRDSGVGNSNCNGSCNDGYLRVHASVNERHLLKEQGERIMSKSEGSLMRVGVKGISMRGRRRVGRTSFWCHRG
jgi:hypothetical protein